MDKTIKLEKLKYELNKISTEISNLDRYINTNQEKIKVKDLEIRRMKSNLQIREKELFDLHNYRKREETKKVQLEANFKKINQEISTLTRQINREKISR